MLLFLLTNHATAFAHQPIRYHSGRSVPSVHIGRAYALHNYLSDMMIDLHQLNKKVERLPSWRTLSILHMEGMPCQLKRDAKFGGLMQCAEKGR